MRTLIKSRGQGQADGPRAVPYTNSKLATKREGEGVGVAGVGKKKCDNEIEFVIPY